ncbi:MAG: hypothetical protein WBF18_08225 [Solirubrobacterales bacterium]
MSCGPAAATSSGVSAVKPAIARRVTRRESENDSRFSAPPTEESRVRCGKSEVATAWNSSGGARTSIRTLKMNPAAAVPSSMRTNSGPPLSRICSAPMMNRTAIAKLPPSAVVSVGGACSPGA